MSQHDDVAEANSLMPNDPAMPNAAISIL